MHDALADGRVDLAFTLPAYDPAEFPVFDAMSTALAVLPTSPYAGELVANAAGAAVAWDTPQLIEEFTDKDLQPLIPLIASGGYYTICADPLRTADDFAGRQIRIGSAAQSEQVSQLGASPVSLPFPETYEALQRALTEPDRGARQAEHAWRIVQERFSIDRMAAGTMRVLGEAVDEARRRCHDDLER